MAKNTNLYARLGLPLDANAEDIRRAYREAALRLHPDTNVEQGATELFLGVQEAFEVLSHPDRRKDYDHELPVEVKSVPNICLNTVYSIHSLQKASRPQLVYVLLELISEAVSTENTHPINMCLVVDSSTSMQGPAMDTVKASAVELVRQLRPHDILSLVSFSDRAAVLLPAANKPDPRQAELMIQMLKPGGGTEIYKGLEAGFSEVQNFYSPNHANHIILITDGRTYGDEAACYLLANQAISNGIVINTLGIGSKWNESFLDSLASMTGGTCQYVSSPQEIRNYLWDKFEGLGKNYAERVAYQFNLGPSVSLSYAMRMQPEVAPLEVQGTLQLGSIPYGSRLLVLFELLVQDIFEDADKHVLTEGRLYMDIPSRDVPRYVLPLNLSRKVGGSHLLYPMPASLIQAAGQMTMYRMQERAQNDAAGGKLDDAFRTLQYLAMNLMASGQHSLAQTVMKEASILQTKQGLSEEGRKRLRFGTRSLSLPQTLPPP